MRFQLLILFLLGLTVSCSSTKNRRLVAHGYNPETQITTLKIVPYGNIKIPGQWNKTNYNEVSGQHFFKDADKNSIAVTKSLKEKYPFYKENTSDQAFARSFFEWEKEYYEKQGFKITEQSAGANYIIWTATGNNANTIFLYGAKDKYAYNYAVFSGCWPSEKRTDFLKKLFENN
ncbi:MAG: hypothetical protein ACFB10_21150 [Salibacteraceae bacterium]